MYIHVMYMYRCMYIDHTMYIDVYMYMYMYKLHIHCARVRVYTVRTCTCTLHVHVHTVHMYTCTLHVRTCTCTCTCVHEQGTGRAEMTLAPPAGVCLPSLRSLRSSRSILSSNISRRRSSLFPPSVFTSHTTLLICINMCTV